MNWLYFTLRGLLADGQALVRRGRTFVGVTLVDSNGDLAAAGGYRQWVPSGWQASDIAAGSSGTPASSTPVPMPFKLGDDPVMNRPGSVMGFLFQLDTNPAGSAIVLAVTLNGTVQAATATTLAAGSVRVLRPTFAKDLVPFVAGDVLGLAIRTGTGWSATSANGAGLVEIES